MDDWREILINRMREIRYWALRGGLPNWFPTYVAGILIEKQEKVSMEKEME